MTKNHILQYIYNSSKIGYAKSAGSIVDKLIEAKWCTKNDLIQTFEKLEDKNSPSAASFFQLPYPINIPNEWIKLKRRNIPDIEIIFKIIGTDINLFRYPDETEFALRERKEFSGHDTYVNGFLSGDCAGQLLKTQVIIVFELWRLWREAYPSYEKKFSDSNYGTCQ